MKSHILCNSNSNTFWKKQNRLLLDLEPIFPNFRHCAVLRNPDGGSRDQRFSSRTSPAPPSSRIEIITLLVAGSISALHRSQCWLTEGRRKTVLNLSTAVNAAKERGRLLRTSRSDKGSFRIKWLLGSICIPLVTIPQQILGEWLHLTS